VNTPSPSSVWNQLFDDPVVALDLDIRSQLLMQLQDFLATTAGQGRIKNLSDSDRAAIRAAHIGELPLSDLVRITAQLRCRVTLNLEPRVLDENG
jgi:predicted XRE-type DNA-binding protein